MGNKKGGTMIVQRAKVMIIACFSFFLLASAATAETYFVSSSLGNDDGSGTENDPWQTIQRVNEQQYNPNDIIHFKRGDIWLGEQLIVQGSGSDDNAITYTAYGEGAKPVFNLNGVEFDGIDINEKDYIVIDSITIRNLIKPYRQYGVHVYKSNHVKVQNCTIVGEHNVNSRGICIESTSDDIIIEYNDISLCMVGVNVRGSALEHPSNVRIRYNTIHDMDKGTLVGADGIFFDSVDNIPIDYNGTIIEHNHIYNCADQHIDLIRTQNVIVRYNKCHGTVCTGGDGNGIKLSLDEKEVASTGLNVYYNIVYDTRGPGIVGGGFEGNFFNNVIYNTGGACLFTYNLNPARVSNIINNIFTNPGAGNPCVLYYSHAINTLNNNCYWKNNEFDDLLIIRDGIQYSLSQWANYQQVAFPIDQGSIAQDPLFLDSNNDHFELQQHSPCVNSGADVHLSLPDSF